MVTSGDCCATEKPDRKIVRRGFSLAGPPTPAPHGLGVLPPSLWVAEFGCCGWPSLSVSVVGVGRDEERRDLKSSHPSCGRGWVGVSQVEESRRPFVS